MYLTHLTSERAAPIMIQEEFEAPYYDYLQVPLQPLGDNLESSVYSIFEQDDTKYNLYQQASKLAIMDLINTTTKNDFLTCLVVGAGRGMVLLFKK